MSCDEGRRNAMRVHRAARTLFNRLGYDVTRLRAGTAFSRQREALLTEHGITLAIDVGASRGEYAGQLRACGFEGRIISLEPLARSFTTLVARAEADPRWQTFQVAAGAHEGVVALNVSGRDDLQLAAPDG